MNLMMKFLRNNILIIFTLSLLIFCLGFASAIFKITFVKEIKLSEILTVTGWVVAVLTAWFVARRQLILNQRSSAVRVMMHSNRELTSPLTRLAKIMSFEETTVGYYSPMNYKALFNELRVVHDEIRGLLITRTQNWEEYRISLIPTESEFLFINYLLQDLREDLYEVISNNKDIETVSGTMNFYEYKKHIATNLRFDHLKELCVNVIVLSLDYGNLLQNQYLGGLYKESIPDRKPIDNAKILKDYNSKFLVATFQTKRDQYYVDNSSAYT